MFISPIEMKAVQKKKKRSLKEILAEKEEKARQEAEERKQAVSMI